jgi:sugar (pentulose or hexulose) kinase
MAYLMGIDIGSTNLKAAIYDYSGNFISLGSTPNEVVCLDKEHPQWAF